MCGIAGWVDFKGRVSNEKDIIVKMTDTLKLRGPDAHGYYIGEHALLGHRRLVVVDPQGGAQPMTRSKEGNHYTIVYNGELYNTEELRRTLKDRGYDFESYSDTEVLLNSYIEFGEGCLKLLNGIYAFGIYDEKNEKLFLARDPLGVKPLFYAFDGSSIIFGSEIKTILAHPNIRAVVGEEGLAGIFGLGPARALGSGIFKGINEIPPANCLTFTREGFKLKEYWELKYEEHKETLEETTYHVRELFLDTVKRQLVADVPVCTFLSGGLDSSAISSVAMDQFSKEKRGNLSTFSIDYTDNELYFKANEFQPNSDAPWVKKMVDYLHCDHNYILLEQEKLALSLADAVRANDLPGMADIDSSLYLFCKEVRKKSTVALSGECVVEVKLFIFKCGKL
ncbi:MAG TPA: asparagine synthase (glutamine-hydrolyzing) [Clostridiaceae bacterium]